MCWRFWLQFLAWSWCFCARGWPFDRVLSLSWNWPQAKASKIVQAPRVIKMFHTMADTFWKTYDYFKVLLPWDTNSTKLVDGRKKPKGNVWEESFVEGEWNRSQLLPAAMPGGLNVSLTMSISVSQKIMGSRNRPPAPWNLNQLRRNLNNLISNGESALISESEHSMCTIHI